VLNGNLTLDLRDQYNLIFGGDLSGHGGLDSAAGNVFVNGPGNQTYGGPTVVSGGLFTTNAPVIGTPRLELDGGDAVINAPFTTAGGSIAGLDMRGFMTYAYGGRSDYMIDLEFNGELLAKTPVGDTLFQEPLNLNGDAQFRALIPEITRNDDYQSLWVGTFTAQLDGAHQFRTPQTDDRGAMWIDLDQDGVFERYGDAGDERVSWEGGTGTRTLAAGQDYAVAVAHMEHGGGSTIQAQFLEPGQPWVTVDPGTQPHFTTIVQGEVFVDNGTLDINAPLTTDLLAVLGGGTANANVADAIPGAQVEIYGRINATVDAALRASNTVTANYAGTVNIGAAQSAAANFGNIIVAPGGILMGDLTNATYGAGNIELQDGAVLAQSAGPAPTYAQVGTTLLERITGVNSATTYNWGDDGSNIYKGGAFNSWTSGGNFEATVNDVSPGQTAGFELLMLDRNVTINGTTTLNTANATRGAEFTGEGQLLISNPWGGSAPTVSRVGNFDDAADALSAVDMNTTNDWIVRLENGSVASGKTVSASNGKVSIRNVASVAAGGVLNINQDASIQIYDNGDGRRPSTGTYNINAGGLVEFNNWNRLVNGATFNFHPDSYVFLRDNLNGANQTVNQADPNASPGADGIWNTYDAGEKLGFDDVNIIVAADQFGYTATGGGGLYLGAGRRLTTAWNQQHVLHATTTAIRKSASMDPTGSFVIFSSPGGQWNSNGTGGGEGLNIDSEVQLPGVDIYINDPAGTLISLPQQEGNMTRRLVAMDGRVNIDRHTLQCDDLVARNGYLRLGDNNDFDIDSTGSLILLTDSRVELQSNRPLLMPKLVDGSLFPGGIVVENGSFLDIRYDPSTATTTIDQAITFTAGSSPFASTFRMDEQSGGGDDVVVFPNLTFADGARVGIDRQDQDENELDMYITLTGDATIEREPDTFDLYDVLGPGHTLTAGNPRDSNDLTNRPDNNRFDLEFFGTITANIDLAHVRGFFRDGSQVVGDAVINSRSPLTVEGGTNERIVIFAGEYTTNPITGGIFQVSGDDRMRIDVRDGHTNDFSGTVRIIDDGDLGTQDGRLLIQREGGGGTSYINVKRLEVGPGATGVVDVADAVHFNIAEIYMGGPGSSLDLDGPGNGTTPTPNYVGGVGRIFNGDLDMTPNTGPSPGDGGLVQIGVGAGGLQIDTATFPFDDEMMFQYSIDGPSPGVYFEQLTFGSLTSVDLSDAWLDADIVVGGAIQVGDEVTILQVDGGTVSGLFRDPVTGLQIPEGGSFFVGLGETSADQPNVTWMMHYDYTGGEVLLTALQLVPEPTTATLLGLSLLALARRRRRRK
jgi:hypothetical protein